MLFPCAEGRPVQHRGNVESYEPLKRLRRIDEAIELLRAALRLQPQKASIWQTLGASYVDVGQHKEAYHCFRKALQLDPSLTQARQGLELVLSDKARPDPAALLQQGKIDEAKQVWAEQASVDPKNTTAWHNLGVIHLEQKNPREAMRCFTNVHRLDPTDDFAIQRLVRLHSERGEFDRALGYCERLANLPGQEDTARRLKSVVVNLRDAGAPSS
ncbi:MAG: tetratricopeptide repeat protein [Dehalococcoidia bacterium]|uniref:tetratricopeptide repeat protein n=1 Tax=Candidatus Amarobacter glycogenicus TaxID=3140699 RepID=UPI003135A725|nr:tetratricopeptide repeat protein [Dehalococcoidia bacterium]